MFCGKEKEESRKIMRLFQYKEKEIHVYKENNFRPWIMRIGRGIFKIMQYRYYTFYRAHQGIEGRGLLTDCWPSSTYPQTDVNDHFRDDALSVLSVPVDVVL